MVVHAFNLSRQRAGGRGAEAEGISEFKASLDYRVSSSMTRAAQRNLNLKATPTSKKKEV